MQKFYFMKKAEVVEAEQYENPDGYAQFHYSRENRIAQRRKEVKPEQPLLFPFFRRKKGKSSRKIVYAVDVLILLGMFVYWKTFTDDYPSRYVEAKTWVYFLKVSPSDKGFRECFVFLKNISKNQSKLEKKLKISFFKGSEKESKEFKTIITKPNPVTFKPGETKALASAQFNTFETPEAVDFKLIKVKINDKITIYKKFK